MKVSFFEFEREEDEIENFFFFRNLWEKWGYEVVQSTTLFDSDKMFREEVENALDRTSLVFLIGKVFDEKMFKDFCLLFACKQEDIVPRKGEFFNKVFENCWMFGCEEKKGFLFRNQGKVLVWIPKNAKELKGIFESDLFPFLSLNFFSKEKIFRKNFYLCLFSEQVLKSLLETWREKYPIVKLTEKRHFGILHLQIQSKDENSFLALSRNIEEVLFSSIFSFEDGDLSEVVHRAFLEKEKTLALAESCSGGSLAYEFVRHPNASRYFLGSIVAYSNELKETLLNVFPKTLSLYGPVSKETVQEMVVKGVLEKTRADYALAISGLAGPGGETEKTPVGTVYIAVGEKEKKEIDVGKFHFSGSREEILLQARQAALGILWRRIVYQKTFFIKA